ncbi:sugar transferase [Lentibacillus sp.]|uniref:sugar transferase n=1 Tax=Lentibacillus sp. TaxID=1925746 RepID=UPI002B4B6231|nr:sugar transferase [Lentibacillus sp.]HLS10046.1 sugar transferase [Lentibacillus sp.]
MEVRESVRLRSYGRRNNFYLTVKRLMDVLISLFGLCILLPLMVWISYQIMKKDGRPVFFRQAHVGKGHREFIMLTFRTMTNASKVIRALPPHPFPENWANGVPDAFYFTRNPQQMVTGSGKWIKKYHLEKLPALINILKGDMSLVGPSPEIPEIADHYNRHQAQRLRMKPGLTGLAQIHDHHHQNHGKKVMDDLHYINDCSAKLDIKILYRTLKRLVN